MKWIDLEFRKMDSLDKEDMGLDMALFSGIIVLLCLFLFLVMLYIFTWIGPTRGVSESS